MKNPHLYPKGVSGNPAGKPKGAKNRFSTAFIDDVASAWEENGEKALRILFHEDPGKFVSVCAQLFGYLTPKQLNVSSPVLTEMENSELEAALQAVRLLRQSAIEGQVINPDEPVLKLIGNGKED
jgi:hypothetical protein